MGILRRDLMRYHQGHHDSAAMTRTAIVIATSYQDLLAGTYTNAVTELLDSVTGLDSHLDRVKQMLNGSGEPRRWSPGHHTERIGSAAQRSFIVRAVLTTRDWMCSPAHTCGRNTDCPHASYYSYLEFGKQIVKCSSHHFPAMPLVRKLLLSHSHSTMLLSY